MGSSIETISETFPVILMTKPLDIHHRKNKQSLIAISTVYIIK